ncbi:radical SAM protein [Candidatus Pacearchaeota archaeon]|nr:radical SAM protein [Candidatus Pacearchaeota archaeon]
MKIGYVTFGKDDFGYAMSYVLYKNGISAKRASIKSAKHFDVLLFSCFWWAHVYEFVNFCIKAGIGYKKKTPRIIVGGFNAFNPLVFLPWAHQVVVGDGEDILKCVIDGESHPSVFTGTEKEVLYNHCSIADNDFIYRSGTITRIEIARGCKYKCPYCQLTHLKKYREASLESVKSALDKVETKRVALFAPCGMSHKNYKEISEYTRERGLVNIASDVRYNEIEKYDNNNTARMGIEGLSYKLRKSITKPITNKKFVEIIEDRSKKCREIGYKPSIHTYFILDLPKESKEDWEEFEELLAMVNEIKGVEDLTWIITANVFMPCPHTPFENEEIHLDRDYNEIWRQVMSDRWRKNKFKFTIAGRHSIFSPYSRLLSMIATRGGEESGEIIYNVVNNKRLKKLFVGKWQSSLKALSGFLDNYGGIEKYVGKPEKTPWKVVNINR